MRYIMQTYKLTWQPKSPIGTEIQSDTVFGHFCWALFYIKGEGALTSLLNELRERPALIFSSAFPKGFLPLPRSLPVKAKTWDEVKQMLPEDKRIGWDTLRKKLKKINLIPSKMWEKESVGFSWTNLYKAFLANDQEILDNIDFESMVKQEAVIHNQINRLTETTSKDSGGPFAEITNFFSDNFSFESYLATDLFNQEDLAEIFQYIEKSGWGRNKSTGQGHMKLTLQSTELPTCEKDPNAWMTLSNMIPDKD